MNQIVSDNHWQESVRFHGRVSDEILASYMEQSDILTVPSSWEGYGIVYLEAMTAGCIPLASSSGGAVEIIENGVSGFLIDEGDFLSVKDIFHDLIEHPQKRMVMQKQARDRALKFETWEGSMKKIEKFLIELTL